MKVTTEIITSIKLEGDETEHVRDMASAVIDDGFFTDERRTTALNLLSALDNCLAVRTSLGA